MYVYKPNTRKQKSNLPVFQDDFTVPSFLVVICCNVHVVAPPFKGTNLLSIQCVVPCIFLQFFVRTQVCCQHQGFAQLLGTKDAVFAILRMGSGNGEDGFVIEHGDHYNLLKTRKAAGCLIHLSRGSKSLPKKQIFACGTCLEGHWDRRITTHSACHIHDVSLGHS